MNRRSFIRLAGGGLVLAATTAGAAKWFHASQVAMPDAALQGWRSAGQVADLRERCLSYAILAPNPHNMQPWIADLSDPDTITIRHDTTRLLPETDPYSRQILLGLGCFLETLKVAAGDMGVRAEFELFPDGAPGEFLDGRRAVRITLTPDRKVTRDPLFAQILARRTDRRAYDVSRPVTASEADALITAAAGHSVLSGVVTDPTEVARVREIAIRAMQIEMVTEGAFMESMRVLRVGTQEILAHRDGISVTSPVPVVLSKTGLFDRTVMPEPESMAVKGQIQKMQADMTATPAYLWIVSDGNSREAQVNAGRAYVRMNLAATGLGLSVHPNQQSLQEYEAVAEPYRAIHAELAEAGQVVQMLARVGKVTGQAELSPAPRRALQDFLT
ncbi:twin-arginine translocation pathway signal protein [Shimia sp.]|uniref:Acg family FMN-binding oxidoreductase n=1 Tax=Shimia sp. TaxID=1954381 RepID=UPI003297DD55